MRLVEVQARLKRASRSKKGHVFTFEVDEADYTATMAVLPLEEPMILILEKDDVGA